MSSQISAGLPIVRLTDCRVSDGQPVLVDSCFVWRRAVFGGICSGYTRPFHPA